MFSKLPSDTLHSLTVGSSVAAYLSTVPIDRIILIVIAIATFILSLLRDFPDIFNRNKNTTTTKD